MRVPRRSPAVGLTVALLGILLSATPTRAATRTWTGAGSNDNWTNAANWGGTAPSAGDDLVFPGGTPRLNPINDFPANTSFNSIAFSGPTGGYTLSGSAVQLVAGLAASNSTGNSTVQLPITLAASLTFACTILGPLDRLTISAAVDLGSNTLTLDPLANSIISLNGIIAGVGGLTSSGPGITFVDANMTYTGPTNVNAGTVALAFASLSPSSQVTVTGGFLQFSNGSSTGDVTATGGEVGCEGGGTSQIGQVANLDLQAGSTLLMVLYSATNYGQLITSGDVTLTNPTLTLAFAFSSSTGDAFTIIKNGGGAVSGTFAGLPEGTVFNVGGRDYQITYAGGDGNDVVVTDVTAGGPTPTPTPTATVTVTPPPASPTPTATPLAGVPTPTPGPGPAAPVPTLSTGLIVLLGLALALVAMLVIRRSG